MSNQEAAEILQTLLKGFCPRTGEELPPEDSSRQPEVAEAMTTAALSLRRRELGQPRRANHFWGCQEVDQLFDELHGGLSIETIAWKHGRTVGAIWARLQLLDVLPPAQKQSFGW